MSTSTKTQRGRKVLTAAAALSIGTVGLFATAVPASAANIDESLTGSLTIHKYENPGNGIMNPDGTGSLPSTNAIKDVVFQACKIAGIDILDSSKGNAEWEKLRFTGAQLEAAAPASVMTVGNYTLTNCVDFAPTDAAGKAEMLNMDLGAYFVREISAPSTVIKKATPFVVTIPTPSINQGEGNGTWIYDVHVYPKNTLVEAPVKNIENQPGNGAIIGAPIDYTVTHTVPGLDKETDTYNKYVVTDTLDTKLDPLTAKPVTVTLNGTALAPGDFTAEWLVQKLTVKLTPDGLAKLKAGDEVVVGFQAAANEAGSIENQAFVNVNDIVVGTNPYDPENPTNVVTTRWGQILLQKVDQGQPAKGLFGAEFEVYMSTVANGCLGTPLGEMTKVKDVDGSDYVAKSQADGTINIPGLWVGDDGVVKDADGNETKPNNLSERCYVLVETKAPAGFVLPAGDAAKKEVVVAAGAMSVVPVENIVPNQQQEVPELPLTGAAGAMIMVLGGSALVAAGVGGAALSRRRKNTAA